MPSTACEEESEKGTDAQGHRQRPVGLLVDDPVGGPGTVDGSFADPVVDVPAAVHDRIELLADFFTGFFGDFGGGGEDSLRGIREVARFVAEVVGFDLHGSCGCVVVLGIQGEWGRERLPGRWEMRINCQAGSLSGEKVRDETGLTHRVKPYHPLRRSGPPRLSGGEAPEWGEDPMERTKRGAL
jgi:hypothetical protein